MPAERVSLQPITNPFELGAAVRHVPDRPDRPIVAELPNLEQFMQAVYGADVVNDRLMVRCVTRPREGIGPHWDIHTGLVDPELPFVATYNLRGGAALRTATLDAALHQHYLDHFPDATEGARDARRVYGGVAFTCAKTMYEATIRSGTGLIIPQVVDADPLVHDIRPATSGMGVFGKRMAYPGIFVKLVVPADTDEARAAHTEEGFVSAPDYLQAEADRARAREESQRVESETPFAPRRIPKSPAPYFERNNWPTRLD